MVSVVLEAAGLKRRQGGSMSFPEEHNSTSNEFNGDSSESKSPYSEASDLHSYSPNDDDERRLRSIRTKITIAYVAGPVSLLIGGILLGSVGLICGIIAYRSILALQSKSPEVAAAALSMRKSAITGMVISAIAIALNVISLIALYPVIAEMIDSGALTLSGTEGAGSSSSASSVWG